MPRKWLVAGIGALIAGSGAAYYAAGNEPDIGGCSSTKCVVPVTIGFGAFLGFLIGSEMDHLYGERYRHAPPISLKGVELPLGVAGYDIRVSERLVLVAGEAGVELVRAGPRLERLGLRARGLRGIGAMTSDSAANSLLVGTGVGLYRFPLWDETPGALVHNEEISAVSTAGTWVALGVGPAFQIGTFEDTIAPVAEPIEEFTRVVDLAWSSDDLLWVLTEERLASYAIDSQGTASYLGEFTFPTTGRRISLDDTLAAVAVGSGGVYVLSIADPSSPKELTNWSGARFAYDVALTRGHVYLAAGPEGLYVLRLEGDRFAPVGLARNLGFIAAVETDGESVYLLDRAGRMLRRVSTSEDRR